ncbi:serine protease SP24D-like [Trichogramma pretiosum]|uniref:serine protease SP24D-like n=1 Tax=Trichogramma pretiosum TaxID=7493 RepID=UPI000C71B9D1|nr:serine protease SP24D-like [Trichogramma pretiosum]XP_023315865.1 serine protease SP24D-like [Trichogramma pretiosum]
MKSLMLPSTIACGLLVFFYSSIKVEALISPQLAAQPQFPHVVAVIDKFSRRTICTGALISEAAVLTAAHCVTDENGKFLKKHFSIIAGTIDLSTPHVEVPVAALIVPTAYNGRGQAGVNDLYRVANLAVLKLAGRVPKKSVIKPLPISSSRASIKEKFDKAPVAGFGISEISHHSSRRVVNNDGKLHFALMEPLSQSACNLLVLLTEDNSAFCAKIDALSEGSSLCAGDDGTPYVLNSKIVGILTYVPKTCNGVEMSPIFTRTSAYADFIENAIKHMYFDGARVGHYVPWYNDYATSGNVEAIQVP